MVVLETLPSQLRNFAFKNTSLTQAAKFNNLGITIPFRSRSKPKAKQELRKQRQFLCNLAKFAENNVWFLKKVCINNTFEKSM